MRKPARRKCAHCREWFHPAREGQVVCSFECASAIGKKQTAKAREAAKARAVKRQRESEKEGRQRRRAKRESFKTKAQWDKEAQSAFNRYHQGLNITEAIPSGDSAVGNYVEEGRELALRCLPGAYKKDSPIKLGTAGQFTLATSDTDSVIGYSQDEYTIAASTTDYIRVRMRVGTVAAGA